MNFEKQHHLHPQQSFSFPYHSLRSFSHAHSLTLILPHSNTHPLQDLFASIPFRTTPYSTLCKPRPMPQPTATTSQSTAIHQLTSQRTFYLTICHAISAMLSPLCYLRHAISAMLSPPCYLRHTISIMLSPPCYLRHAISAMLSPPCFLPYYLPSLWKSVYTH